MFEDLDHHSIHEEEEDTGPVVQLGYAEDPVDEEVPFSFLSKIGGTPAWLNPSTIPGIDSLTCSVCTQPLIYLMQVYAPEDIPEEAFHRVVFVFCCRNGACHKTSMRRFKVFRAQLPRENPFYPPPASEEDEAQNTATLPPHVPPPSDLHNCAVCGIRATKMCSQCRGAHYCSKEHQTIHWSLAQHKLQCPIVAAAATEETTSNATAIALETPEGATRLAAYLFPLSEIVSEPEEPVESSEDPEDAEEHFENAVELSDRMAAFASPAMVEAVEDCEDTETEVDQAFLAFQERISRSPDQIMRYARTEYGQASALPLWLSDKGKPEGEIPACERCGAGRTFEFQILPQLLNHLKIDHFTPDSLDWGTIAVWTCAENCDTKGEYVEEYFWRQDVSEEGMGDNYRKAASERIAEQATQ